jgi:hypothetical protein
VETGSEPVRLTEAESAPQVSGDAEAAQSDQQELAAQPQEAPATALPRAAAVSDGVAAGPGRRWAKAKAAKTSTGKAKGAGQKKTPSVIRVGGKKPARHQPSEKKASCMLVGCSQKHGLDDCITFQRMTPKQRLDMVHQRELCLFCLRHLMGRECWSLKKVPNCTINGGGKPHHEMPHEALKAGEHSMPAQTAALAAAGEAPSPVTNLKRELLEDWD